MRKGNIHVPSLYSTTSESPYFYYRGFNLRAFASWIIAIALVIPGVAGAINPGSIGVAAVRMYNMGFLLSTTVGGLLYYVFSVVWPVDLYPPQFADRSKSWEAMRFTEGFFAEEEGSLAPSEGDEAVIDGKGLDGGSRAATEADIADKEEK